MEIVQAQIKSNLDYSLIGSNNFQLKLERKRLITDIIHPTVNIFRGQIKMQRLRLEVLYEYPTDPWVMIDELRV